jgi:predicted RNA-binding protein with PUA-like domain
VRGAKARPADAGRPPSEGTQTRRPPSEGTKNFWLVKSEPDAFSWDQQVANGVEPWTGVRNHMAKQNLIAMKTGDRAFFYHSNIGKEIVGVVEVVREAYPDPSAEAGAPWVCVDMKAVGPVPRPVTLAAIKAEPSLEGIALVRMSRLSVMPISAEHWTILATMGGWKGK